MAKTLLQLTEQIQEDLNLVASNGSMTRGSSIITPDQIKKYIREAVDDAAGFIMDLWEDYFLVVDEPIVITSGLDTYNLPSDIYVNKIRRMIYNENSVGSVSGKIYQINYIRNLSECPAIVAGSKLKFLISNKTGVGYKIKFYPVPDFSSATFVRCDYIRRANPLLNDGDYLDIPQECQNYVLANAKWRCMFRIPGDPRLASLEAEMTRQEKRLSVILSNKIPDNHSNELEPDISHYQDDINSW